MANGMDWLDSLLATAGIAVLIARQFFWRRTDPARLLKFPLVIVAVGLVWMSWDLAHGAVLSRLALVVVGAEAALVFLTGVAMGLMTQLRRRGSVLSARLAPAGVGLWGIFLAVRIASFVVAGRAGVHLLDTAGAIMLSFGINRLASAAVLKTRIERRERPSPPDSTRPPAL